MSIWYLSIMWFTMENKIKNFKTFEIKFVNMFVYLTGFRYTFQEQNPLKKYKRLQWWYIIYSKYSLVSLFRKQFDYRPYVINWLLHLRMLDGELVTPKESLKVIFLSFIHFKWNTFVISNDQNSWNDRKSVRQQPNIYRLM